MDEVLPNMRSKDGFMIDYVRKDLIHAYLQCGRNKALSADVIHGLIEQIPVADVQEVVHGHWVDDNDPSEWTCSECHYRVMRYNNTAFCPNCGAKMDLT